MIRQAFNLLLEYAKLLGITAFAIFLTLEFLVLVNHMFLLFFSQ
jgi:hypothetical protein